jgi:excinuclease ABC subunit A
MLENDNNIEVLGARVHNLKNIDVRIPREKLVVITGLSVRENPFS